MTSDPWEPSGRLTSHVAPWICSTVNVADAGEPQREEEEEEEEEDQVVTLNLQLFVFLPNSISAQTDTTSEPKEMMKTQEMKEKRA